MIRKLGFIELTHHRKTTVISSVLQSAANLPIIMLAGGKHTYAHA